MYLNFYNLKKEPFNITPDPELLFLSPSHREALAAVVYGVKQRKGFIAILGEVGVGKTTIIRSFLDKVNKQKLKTIYLFNANLSFKALLRTIYQSLGHTATTDDVFEMVDQLHHLLIEEYKEGNNVVLVIDEAQNMPVETLENLRMLSNLETTTDKLIQVVFSGQPEFEDKLNATSLRQLRQRIVIRVKIASLTRAESLAYIKFRLAKSALKDTDIFSNGALRQIVKKAGGIPRIINILCDNCLITSFGRQQKIVGTNVAREIIADLDGARPVAFRWGIAVATAAVLAAVTLLASLNNASHEAAPRLSPNVPGPTASQPAPPQELRTVQATVSQVAVPNDMPRTTADVPDREAVKKPDREVVKKPERKAVKKPNRKVGKKADRKVVKPGDTLAKENGLHETFPEGYSVRKVIKKGDTLANLILETYGSSDRQLVEMVKRYNPNIVNEDILVEGEYIYLPMNND